MKKIKNLFFLLFAFVVAFNLLNLNAFASSKDNTELPYTTLSDKDSKKIINRAKSLELFKKAKKIVKSEGYELNGKRIAVHLNEADTNVAYFYLEERNKKNKNKDELNPFIAIADGGESFIQLAKYEKNGILHSKLYKNNTLFNETYINKDGLFQKGSYVFIEEYTYDLTEMNNKILEEDNDVNKDNMVTASFSWSTFWSCIKKQGKDSAPLRTMVMSACYYVCLTGPPSCITCTAINAGLTLGQAGYCVKKAW
ncbi:MULTISPECIES: hypothetical protein [Neobacillus]|uniref:Uncharacterized protein n=1 Tax=Neobacillus thermocopriae TaxID=1215031 RepID=A0A6B3TNL1_9BACI|nr:MULTISPECIES: hypothetical protein [Neobacillus]NEX77956.1 hypothetical protein [Neobacillus thermocopriae]